MDEDDLLPPASMEDLDEYLDMLYQVGTDRLSNARAAVHCSAALRCAVLCCAVQ